MNEALAMMQDLILMKGSGIESTAALVSIADGDDAQAWVQTGKVVRIDEQ